MQAAAALQANRDSRSRNAVARPLAHRAHRCARAAHARRNAGAHGPHRRSRIAARALPGTRAGLRRGAPPLRDGVASREQAGRVARRSRRAACEGSRERRLPQSASAVVLCRTGDYDAAIPCTKRLVREYPHQARLWLSYGHALKTAGHTARAIEAYREAARLEPRLRRCVVEPGEPQDLPLHARGPRDDPRAARAQRAHARTTACTWTSRSARRWRTRANTPRPSNITVAATRSASR